MPHNQLYSLLKIVQSGEMILVHSAKWRDDIGAECKKMPSKYLLHQFY